MAAFPLYVGMTLLMILGMVQATFRFPIDIAKQYAGLVNTMEACHEALIRYADANPGVSGTIPATTVDAYLAPGTTDPGNFTYLITSPGTATTYLAVAANGQTIAVARLQRLTNYSIIAGPVVAGQIVPRLPTQPVAVAAGVPNGVFAIQTLLRDN